MIVLESRVGIGVPSTTNVDIPTDTTSYVEQTTQQMSEWFGGADIETHNGAFVAKDGRLVKEPIFWVISYCTTQQLEDRLLQVVFLAKMICRDLKQESVAIIINNTMVLITAD